MSNKILFFGNERLATGVTTDTPVFQALLDAGHEIVGLVIAQNEGQSSRKERPLEIIELARQHDIPVLSPAKPLEALDELEALGAEIGILVAYGKLLPKVIIDALPHGIINLHPSNLPKHRGPTPIEHAILDGDAQTAVSIMALSEAMDAGAVYVQEPVSLIGDETKQELADQFGSIGAALIVQHLPSIIDGSLAGEAQDEQQAEYDQRLDKGSGIMDLNKSAQQLAREVRAFAGWPRSKTQLAGIDVVITAAQVGEASVTPGQIWHDGPLLGIGTADGLLIIDQLIPVGKKEMPASAFLAGYGSRL